MKTKALYLIGLFGLLSLVFGCDVSEKDPVRDDAYLLSLAIRMPSEGETRVGLSQKEGTKDLAASWQEDDQVQVIVRRGNEFHDLGKVPVTRISEDGKTAFFNVDIREYPSLEFPFTLFCFTGNDFPGTADAVGGGRWAALCPYDIKRGTLEGFKAPLYCRIEVDGKSDPTGDFEHVGTYELLHVKNDSGNPIQFSHRGFEVETPWYRGSTVVWFTDDYDHTALSGEWEGEAESPEAMVMPHTERVFVSWYIPSGFPISRARLIASVNGEVMRSSNTFTSSASLERSHAYHMYATWDGTELRLKPSANAVSTLEVLPAEIDFGEVVVGNTEYLNLSITNIGEDEETAFISIDGHGPYDGPFCLTNAGLADDYVTRVLEPGATRSLRVSFKPVAVGDFQETILVTSDAIPEGKLLVPVRGKGVEEDTSFHLSASSIEVYVNMDSPVGIYYGSGDYEVINENPDIVDYDINGIHVAHAPAHSSPRKSDATTGHKIEYDLWWITGKKLGDATLRLIDQQTGEELTLRVKVVTAPPLRLAADRIEIIAGKDDKVEILAGCGWYEVTCDNPEIVEARKATMGGGGGGRDDDYQSYSGTYVVLNALLPGQTTVRVKDMSSYDVATIDVTVLPDPYMPEVVDLGLSVKWASFNLGATRPEEFGDYYAWGESRPKDVYSWETYDLCFGSDNTLIRYNADPSYGFEGYYDNKTVLQPGDDAAHCNLGGKWRMPTWEELNELRWSCTWEWVSVNGVAGSKATGPNGNSIFLPAAGCVYGTEFAFVGSWGEYWSSTLVTTPVYDLEDNPEHSSWFAHELSVYNPYQDEGLSMRFVGRSIRPVYDESISTGGGGTVSGGEEI